MRSTFQRPHDVPLSSQSIRGESKNLREHMKNVTTPEKRFNPLWVSWKTLHLMLLSHQCKQNESQVNPIVSIGRALLIEGRVTKVPKRHTLSDMEWFKMGLALVDKRLFMAYWIQSKSGTGWFFSKRNVWKQCCVPIVVYLNAILNV